MKNKFILNINANHILYNLKPFKNYNIKVLKTKRIGTRIQLFRLYLGIGTLFAVIQ